MRVGVDLRTGFPDLDGLPLLRQGIQTRQFCSYDRSGDNYDHEYFPLYMQPGGECVIFDAYGPGCLYRHHMNLWRLGVWKGDQASRPLAGVRIRYYFDGEAKPRIDQDVSTFFSTNNPLGLFRRPLADDGGLDYRLLYHPMFFKKRLKVALSEEPGGAGGDQVPWPGKAEEHPKRRSHWYQYTYHLFAEDPGIDSWAGPADLSAVERQWSRLGIEHGPVGGPGLEVREGEVVLAPSEERILFEARGAGALREIRLRCSTLTRDSLEGAWLKLFWDGEKTASVEAPLASFFGVHPDRLDATYASLLVGHAGEQGLYCRFPMPYWQSARVAVANLSTNRVDGLAFRILNDTTVRYPAGAAGYFRAAYARQFPRVEGRDYRYLDVEGAGHIVGHSAVRWDTSMEENERTYFDGSRTPQIQGDGFEDDQGFGWGLKERSFAVYGAPVAQGGSGTLYRFFLPDLYVFHSSVRHGHIVYGPNSPRGHESNYKVGRQSSITYHYAVSRPTLVPTDELDFGDAASEAAHRLSTEGPSEALRGAWWYDGEFNNVLAPAPSLADDGRAILARCEFTVAIRPDNGGVRLRMRTDKENNRQLARVFVDGVEVVERPWYTVDFEKTYRGIRWADTDFDIPARYTRAKRALNIRLEHAGSELGRLDAFRLWAYSHVDGRQP